MQKLIAAAATAHRAGRFDDAEALYRQIIERYPRHVRVRVNLANVLAELGRVGEAELHFRQALALEPKLAPAQLGLAGILAESGRVVEAEDLYRQAMVAGHGNAQAHYNLGLLVRGRGDIDAAEAEYLRALDFDPAHALALNNLGNLRYRRGDCEGAIELYRRALSARGDYAEAKMNLGQALLALGRFDEGWPLFESRAGPALPRRVTIPPPVDFPAWSGECLTGRSLLLWPEQGLGDEIQFARYAPLVKQAGLARLTIVCAPELKRLFISLPGVDCLLDHEDGMSVPRHDFWCFSLSVPYRLGTSVASIPAELPYLSPPDEVAAHWRTRLPGDGRFRVGLAWRGSTLHANDSQRSLPDPALLAPLWQIPNVSFVSLQKEGDGDSGLPILRFGSELADFADTAALISQLDLVITVDTAVAHLAGALGKVCWVLLPAYGVDWRWLRGRADSPWYPGVMRLFWREAGSQWLTSIEKVAVELAALTAAV